MSEDNFVEFIDTSPDPTMSREYSGIPERSQSVGPIYNSGGVSVRSHSLPPTCGLRVAELNGPVVPPELMIDLMLAADMMREGQHTPIEVQGKMVLRKTSLLLSDASTTEGNESSSTSTTDVGAFAVARAEPCVPALCTIEQEQRSFPVCGFWPWF